MIVYHLLKRKELEIIILSEKGIHLGFSGSSEMTVSVATDISEDTAGPSIDESRVFQFCFLYFPQPHIRTRSPEPPFEDQFASRF
jgi:hypothetical protein